MKNGLRPSRIQHCVSSVLNKRFVFFPGKKMATLKGGVSAAKKTHAENIGFRVIVWIRPRDVYWPGV